MDFNNNYPSGSVVDAGTGLGRDTLLWTLPAGQYQRTRGCGCVSLSDDDDRATPARILTSYSPALTVTSPNGGETLVVGTAATLSFHALRASPRR